MRRTLVAAAACAAAALGTAPAARAQSLEETIGRVLQSFGGQQGYDPRYDPRDAERWRDDRRPAYSERMDARERLEMLDEADQRLDAQQRRIGADRRRIEEERRRLLRGGRAPGSRRRPGGWRGAASAWRRSRPG